MAVLEISRVSKETETYDLATLFPGLTGFTVASVALLPVRTGPTVSTVWTTVTVASGVATVLYAGPDADSTGAVVITGNCDVWVKTTVGSQTEAVKAGRINLAGGGSVTPLPSTYVASVNGLSGNVTLTAADVGAAPAGGGGAVSSVNAKTGAVVLSATDVGADTSGAAAAAQAAAISAAATDATTKANAAQAAAQSYAAGAAAGLALVFGA